MLNPARFRHVVAALGAVMMLFAPAWGQSEDPAELLEDFVHYARIAKPDLAAAYANALLQSGITDAELAELLDEGKTTRERFDAALVKAHRVPELEDIAAELDRRVLHGRLDLARDPQRIEEAISMLTGTQRMKILGRRLLSEASEYAVPALLRVITDAGNGRLWEAAGRMLVEIGRHAVTPLCESLPHLDPDNQRYLCGLLGEIGHPHAAPYLMELAQDQSASATTRDAASRAFRRVGGVNGSLSTLFARLGQQYFNESESLVAYPYEATNNVWSFDPFGGLGATPVATEIFSEVMAMRTASKALEIDPGNATALSLFVAANLKRANELPPGVDDPIYGQNLYSPEFYATVFGTQVCLDVLGMGIDRLDTPLVRDAIAALAQTTGGANLFSGRDGRQPLLESLQYPDRRVQYEAALTLGRALPVQRFAGDVRVVPLLGSAVRTGDESFAVVIADDEEDRRVHATRLENVGFTIVAAGAGLRLVESEIAEAVGVDLVVVQVANAQDAELTVDELHVFPQTTAAPVLLVAASVDMAQLKRDYRDDIRVKVARARVDSEAYNAAVDEVMLRAAGGRMTEAEAEAYAIDAIMTLRDIAISGNTAYAIADAESTLVQALDVRTGGVRLMVADILALIDSERAQEVLFDAALAATGDEQIELLDRVAESVKRFGDRTDPRHVQGVLALVSSTSGRTAEAAARVHGALVLPAGTAIRLIPKE
ncbi:MAG: hypothetical protein ACYS0G_11070 [Planctomycetota bacterium]|jgi:hypothetical protein